jgi:hypothetical protein
MERRHEVQRLLHYREQPEPRAAALDVTSRLRQGGDREPGADEQSDRRSIEGSRRHRAQISDYHGRSAETRVWPRSNATSESRAYVAAIGCREQTGSGHVAGSTSQGFLAWPCPAVGGSTVEGCPIRCAKARAEPLRALPSAVADDFWHLASGISRARCAVASF